MLMATMQGTRAFQSVQVLRSFECNLPESEASSKQRFMHDYADDLESFYWYAHFDMSHLLY